jgi:hypothetical protein
MLEHIPSDGSSQHGYKIEESERPRHRRRRRASTTSSMVLASPNGGQLSILQHLKDKGVDLFLHQQGLDTSTTAGWPPRA